MNDDYLGGFFTGFLLSTILWVVLFLFTHDFGGPAYQHCLEDEVYAWQQNGGDFPKSETWACVPLDNLIGE